MAININYKDIIAKEIKKQEETQSNSNNSGLKVFYPFTKGIVSFKFLPNESNSSIYRTIYEHKCDIGQGKSLRVPCLEQMYGVECPVCNMVRRIQKDYDDKFVFGKYGYKTRGIMYAKFVGVENPTYEEYFKGNKNAPQPGETILFMFPKACINELSNLMTELGSDESEFNYVFVNNTSRIVNLRIGEGANGFPEYRFNTTMKMYTAFKNDNDEPDNETYEKFIKELQGLDTIKYPATIDSSENQKSQQHFVKILEEMSRKYYPNNAFDANTVSQKLGDVLKGNPNKYEDKHEAEDISNYEPPMEDELPWGNDSNDIQENVSKGENEAPITDNSEVDMTNPPPCFGDNKYDEKCGACPFTDVCL